MQIKPLGNYVVVKPIQTEDKDSSGMILSTTSKSVEAAGTWSHGEVLEISEQAIIATGIAIGDKVSVIPGKSGMDKVEYWDGEKVYMMPYQSVVGILVD